MVPESEGRVGMSHGEGEAARACGAATRKDIASVLRNNAQMVEALLASASQAIISMDKSGRIVLANARTQEVFGYSAQELMGEQIEILLPDASKGRHEKLRSDYFAIVTLGFGEAVRVLLENLGLTQGARGLPGLHKFTSLGITLVFLVLVIWLSRNFLRSTFGRNTIAIGQDPVAAEMIGIRLLPNRMLSLAISAAFAGLAGGLLAHYLTFIQPSIFSMDLSGLLTAGVVAGGMGSITGPIVAIALFVGIPELFRGLALWRLVLYGAVLVVIINYRPKGLFGYEELSIANFPKLLVIIGVSIALAVGVGIYNYYANYWGIVPVSTAFGSTTNGGFASSGGRVMPMKSKSQTTTKMSVLGDASKIGRRLPAHRPPTPSARPCGRSSGMSAT